MELSLLTKLRITASSAVGVILIGILAWPLAAPSDLLGVVLAGNVSLVGAVTLAALAFLAGFLAYFISWPYGREIGILAVPSGLAVWSIRSENIASLIQMNPTVAHRQALFAAIKWEPLFWLAIVAVGFAGVLSAQKIFRPKIKTDENAKQANSKSSIYLNTIIALIASALIAQFCIRMFAQDVKMNSVVAQPTTGQIAFAVMVSFGLAAFVVKKFLNLSYIWPTLTCVFVTAFIITTYAKVDTLQYLAKNWPAVFFSNSITAILPIQMVAFSTLGSIAGYWLAVRYDYWRKYEM